MRPAGSPSASGPAHDAAAGRVSALTVEIGCADGDCIAFLASEFKFKEVIGIDIAFPDDMKEEVDGIRFLQANSNERLPLADGSVDVFVAMMVIEHLFDPFHAFAEIKRLLAHHGLQTVAVYNSTEKQPYQLGDRQVYLVAEKQ